MPSKNKPTFSGDVASGNVPVWMDAPFFQKALRAGGEDPEIRVVDCKVWEAMGKGENYISVVYRALVKDEAGKGHHLIVKCLPSNEARKMLSNRAKFFRKEIDLYGVVLPAYEKMCGKLVDYLPWPKHYFSVFNGECDYLVMEDLKKDGFVMEERLKGLDRVLIGAALSALASYHAYSYALKVSDPEAFKNKVVDLFPETMYTVERNESTVTFVKMAYESTASMVRQWGGQKYERIASKIEEKLVTAFDDMIRLIAPVEPGAVLTHGDFWVNNMMFRHTSSKDAEAGCRKPVEVKLIDFQIARYSSPVTDLLYLKVSSATAKTRREHWDELLKDAYLASFWNTLEALGHKEDVTEGVFTFEWLKKEMKRLQPFALMSSVTVVPAVMAESAEAPDMDTLTEDDLNGTAASPFAELYKGKAFQERFRELADEFDEDGLFD